VDRLDRLPARLRIDEGAQPVHSEIFPCRPSMS
jgi:hypothetical protein